VRWPCRVWPACCDNDHVTPSRPAPDPQRAVDRANAAIRAYLRGLPGRSPVTVEQRAAYHQLVDAYLAAVAERDGARRREAADEGEPVAA
jgi:ketosteroid isomerase-like protein